MNREDSFNRLRQQRNGALVAACGLVLLSAGAVAPGFVRRYQRAKSEQVELIRLQGQIVTYQSRSVAVQKQIIETQNQIRALQH